MADIFISYSKPDRFEVEKLAAMLEAEGWSVWWDKGLTAGDTYRDEIMKELARARAVIAVWTSNSIKSDWVRAEAGQAKANGKLIPLKTDGVGYGDIPLPFGEMHTEPIGNAAQIRAAIVAQLAKPQVQPSGIWMATAELRYVFLTWFGIIGGAITLFSSLKGLIAMARWMHQIIDHWSKWTQAFWGWLLGWLPIDVSTEWAHFLSFLLFVAASVLSSRTTLAKLNSPGMHVSSPTINARQNTVIIGFVAATIALIAVAFEFLAVSNRSGLSVYVVPANFLVTTSILVFAAGPQRRAAMIFAALFTLLVLVLGVTPILGSDDRGMYDLSFIAPLMILLAATPLLMLVLMAATPGYLINRRFGFMLTGLLVLIGLSALSTSGLIELLQSKIEK